MYFVEIEFPDMDIVQEYFEMTTSESSATDSSESSDEEYENARVKNEDYFEYTIPQYGPEFKEHFRMSKELANSVAERYENSEYYKYHVGPHRKLTALQQTYIFLWFTGHQTASFRDVADRFNITISSLFRVIRRYTYFLSNLSATIITWPTAEEKIIIERHFRENGFPGVIGVIDGSHVKVDKPSNDPESYINRKGFYSIQVYALQW